MLILMWDFTLPRQWLWSVLSSCMFMVRNNYQFTDVLKKCNKLPISRSKCKLNIQVIIQLAWLNLRHLNGGIMFLRNASKFLPDYMASHIRRKYYLWIFLCYLTTQFQLQRLVRVECNGKNYCDALEYLTTSEHQIVTCSDTGDAVRFVLLRLH
jgi:hypothetical protein